MKNVEILKKKYNTKVPCKASTSNDAASHGTISRRSFTRIRCNDTLCSGSFRQLLYIGGTGRWYHKTWKCGTISQGWTSRDSFQWSSRCSLQVYVCCRKYYGKLHRIKVFSSISFCLGYSQCGRLKLACSLVNVSAHYNIVIDCLINWFGQFLKVFFVDSDAPEVVAAGMGACLSSSSSSLLLLLLLLLLSSRGCRNSVWAPTEWLTARRNCRRL